MSHGKAEVLCAEVFGKVRDSGYGIRDVIFCLHVLILTQAVANAVCGGLSSARIAVSELAC